MRIPFAVMGGIRSARLRLGGIDYGLKTEIVDSTIRGCGRSGVVFVRGRLYVVDARPPERTLLP